MYAVFQSSKRESKMQQTNVSLNEVFGEPESEYSEEELALMHDPSVDVTHYNHEGRAIERTRNRETKPWVNHKKKANKKKAAKKSKKANRKKK